MSQATHKLITADEFFHMPEPPDGSRQELVRGVIEIMPPPGALHGVCCLKVGRVIGNYVDSKKLGTVACNDAGFVTERDPDTVRGADVAFWSRDRLPTIPKGYASVPPDLAVEVVSPEDRFTRFQKKVAHYLKHGVRLLWVIDPEDRSLTVCRPDQPVRILGEVDTVSGEEILPDFSCKLADLLP